VVGGINELVLQHLIERDPGTLPELLPTAVTLIERTCFDGGRGSAAGAGEAAVTAF
jgi:hypothetical protein